MAPQSKILRGVLGEDAGDIGGVHDDGSLLLEDVDSLGHHARLFRREAVAGCWAAREAERLAVAGEVDVIVEIRARNADARALQAGGLEERRVVAAGWRRASLSGRVVGVGGGTFQRAQ